MDTQFIRKGAVVDGYTLKHGIKDDRIDVRQAAVCAAKGHTWTPQRRQNVQIGITCTRCHAAAS